jgi:hypothetical protein
MVPSEDLILNDAVNDPSSWAASVVDDTKDRADLQPREGVNSSSKQLPKKQVVVRFDSIHIREFNRIAGDHPDVRNGGPPLSIGWDYVEREAVGVDEYEAQKEQQQQADQQVRRGLRRLPSGTRRDILRIKFDIPLEEILQAEEEAQRTQKQRAKTNSQRKVFARTEAIVQSATRKLRKTFSSPERVRYHVASPFSMQKPALHLITA